MKAARDAVALARAFLEGAGRVSLPSLLLWAAGEEAVRALCRRFDLKPRGGFRVEKAPVGRLLPLLEEAVLDREDVRADAARAVGEALAGGPRPQTAGEAAREEAAAAGLLRLREQEAARLRAEVERMRAAEVRRRGRLEEAQKRIEGLAAELARARAEREDLARRLREAEARAASAHQAPRGEAARELEVLRRRVESLEAQDLEQRREIARQSGEVRRMEEMVEELQAKVPGRKRPKPAAPGAELPADAFRVPRFQESFYRSLEDKEPRVVRQAFEAVHTLCTQGPSYPGLETKLLEGRGKIWSVRASLKHRVFFRFSGERFLEVDHLADRQEQDRYLRGVREQ